MGPPLVTRQVSNLLVVHLFKVNWSPYFGDFLVDNRACSSWTTKSDDSSGRQILPIFCMTDDRFLLADFIGRRNWPTLSLV